MIEDLSLTDEWQTPFNIYDELCTKYNFYPTLDVCATKDNTLLHDFLGIHNNALLSKWHKVNWCNPPNSKPNKKLFMKKAHEEFVCFKNETLMIIPADSLCTVYAKEYILDPNYHFEPITKRIKFLFDGLVIDNAKKGYFSVFFGNCRI